MSSVVTSRITQGIDPGPPKYNPGDILLVDDYSGQGDIIGNLIRAGERARYGDTDYARWTHSAMVVSENGDLAEALEEGVRRTNISKYANHETLLISPAVSQDKRDYAVAFALAQVGTDYDILDFVALAGSLLTGLDLSLHTDKQFICSGLCSRATECYTSAGYSYPTEQMMPADIGHYFNAISGLPLPPKSWLGRLLDKFRGLMWAVSPFKSGIKPLKLQEPK